MPVIITVSILLCLMLKFVLHGKKTKHKRVQAKRQEVLRDTPLSEAHQEILYRNFPISKKLPVELEARFEGLINEFIESTQFIGCQEQEINDEIKITVAAQACLLILNNSRHKAYQKLHTISIYPNAYMAKVQRLSATGFIVEDKAVRLGESWNNGNLVLSWKHSKIGARNFRDARNVVLHEFAHQLDQDDGLADGIPKEFMERDEALAWAKTMKKEFAELQAKAQRGKKSFLDPYGATNIAEFFAVATETFFEKPRPFKRKFPELYIEFKKYYGIDPQVFL